MVSKNFDLVVIGAGTAGCLAAYTAAKEGLSKIALVDRKPQKLIGKKICGDGIGTKHLDFLQELGFPIKENNILANIIKTAHLISPDKKKDYALPVQGQLAIINRHQFGQILLEETLNQ
ncbi:MAG: FAD-binding protein, partial [Asgard group archaeon]|nr:FAD-binding protein [Asgard group archaeon]